MQFWIKGSEILSPVRLWHDGHIVENEKYFYFRPCNGPTDCVKARLPCKRDGNKTFLWQKQGGSFSWSGSKGLEQDSLAQLDLNIKLLGDQIEKGEKLFKVHFRDNDELEMFSGGKTTIIVNSTVVLNQDRDTMSKHIHIDNNVNFTLLIWKNKMSTTLYDTLSGMERTFSSNHQERPCMENIKYSIH